MPIEARREYLKAIKERYQKATRKEKRLILNEFCQVCDYNRKHAIAVLNAKTQAFITPWPIKLPGHFRT